MRRSHPNTQTSYVRPIIRCLGIRVHNPVQEACRPDAINVSEVEDKFSVYERRCCIVPSSRHPCEGREIMSTVVVE